MYIDKRRKTVTFNDIRTLIREHWPFRKQLPLDIGPFYEGGPVLHIKGRPTVPSNEEGDA